MKQKVSKILSIICALALIVSCTCVGLVASAEADVTPITDKTIPTDLGTNHFAGSFVAVSESGKDIYAGSNSTNWTAVTTSTEATPTAVAFHGVKTASSTILTEENNAVGQTEYYLQMTVILPEPVNNPTTFHYATNLQASSNGQLSRYYEIFASNNKADLYNLENSCGVISTTTEDTTTRQYKVDISEYELSEVKYFGIRFYHRPYSNRSVQISSIGLYGGEKEVKGDVDGDGDCDTSDLANLKLLLAGVKAVGNKGIVNPDVNTDGEVNTTDLEQLRSKLSGGEIDDTLKILAFGNSFSVDAMEHLDGIMDDGGIEKYVLGNLYIGNCSIAKHITNLNGNIAEYEYYKNTSGSLHISYDFSANEALAQEDWDIISIQHNAEAYDAEHIGDFEALIELIKAVQPNATIVWHMTWAFAENCDLSTFVNVYNKDQMTMYNAITDCVKTVIEPNEKISMIIPSGTSIQNLRTSYIGDTLNRDGYHLSYGTGRYTAALTWYAVLTGRSIDNISFVPIEFPEIEAQLPAIKDAVNKAIAKPFEVTESAYKAQE